MDIFRITKTYFRIGILGELEYRANLFVQLFESVLGIVVGLGGLAVVFSHTDRLGDWLPGHLITLVGIHYLIGGLIALVISPSMERLMQDVREGTLDFVLTKPADSQLLVSVQRFELWKLVDIVLGIGVVLVGLRRLQTAVGGRETAVFLLALLCGAAIVYSFWIVLATTSFWFVRVENILVIFNGMYSAGRWPVTIYPGWLRFSLTFIVPVAFAVTVPVQGLIGQLRGTAVWGVVAVAVGLSLFARLFWRFGIRHYSGASA